MERLAITKYHTSLIQEGFFMGVIANLVLRGTIGIFALYGFIKFAEDCVESDRSEKDITIDLDK